MQNQRKTFLPGWASMCGGFVVNIVPRDHVVAAAGAGPAHGEDQPLLEGSSQQLQHRSALRGVRQVGRAGGTFVRLPGVWMLGLQTHSATGSASSGAHGQILNNCNDF